MLQRKRKKARTLSPLEAHALRAKLDLIRWRFERGDPGVLIYGGIVMADCRFVDSSATAYTVS